MSSNPKFTISVVSHKGDYLLQCLSALFTRDSGYARGDIEVILTSNGLPRAVLRKAEELLGYLKHTVIVRNSQNLGFQEPNRMALAIANGKYFIMLNDDLLIEDVNWLKKLERPFVDNVNTALTGPHSGRCALGKYFVGKRVRHLDRFDYIQGSLVMGETRLLRKMGLFDEKLRFAYGEDSDLGLRMKKAGLALATVRLATHHIGGATTRQVPGMASIIETNHAYLREKWAKWLSTGRF